ncbi:type II secretion system protein [Nocardioides gansuensis]|uniref:Type II secretion system protein n=1 Tax=Nocardioides gansuensis TaxID=2138300 RepID=A0A2T8F8R8_9ACTN|nr:type II secretion system F family protein [Nocardioides gansuensis]PVG82116.1 type II secretion system protein [Nocardioides gansuensis]
MTTGLLLGCLLGGSACLFLFALVPPRPRLASAVAKWEQGRARHAGLTAGESDDPRERMGRWILARLARRGVTLDQLRADLALTGNTLEAHLVRKAGLGLFGLLLPAFLAGAVMILGMHPPMTLPALGGLALASLFFWVPDLEVTRQAQQRRHELRRALSCYLDLVSMSLAGGRGMPEALPTAARIGRGWAFELIRDTIEHARYTGITPWAALADLGERTRMPELQDLGGSLLLVADDGAKVRSSLTARAVSQRRRQLAEAEGAAEKADQTIQMAQVVLAVGFFLFIGYPAFIAVMAV